MEDVDKEPDHSSQEIDGETNVPSVPIGQNMHKGAPTVPMLSQNSDKRSDGDYVEEVNLGSSLVNATSNTPFVGNTPTEPCM